MNLRVTNGRTQEQSISSLPEDATESGVIEKRSNSDGSASGGDDSIERGDKSGASDSVKNARAEGERYFANTLKASLQTKALSSNPAKNGNADAAASSPVKTASASGKNGSSEKSSFYALIPKDRETVSDYNLLFAAAQTFYEKEGIKVSKAAIEEVVGQGRIFEKRDFKPDFVRDENGKPILDAEGNPQRAYLITIDEGAKRALLQFKPEAERITREAIPAVHDLTDREREYLVLKIFAEKYAKELPKEALAEVFTLENLGQAALEKILNAAAPGVGSMFGAATFAVVGAPELHFILKDIKRFTYAPTKPSDLDKAAKRLADLARMYAVMKITSKIDKGADRLSAAADGQIPRLSSKLKSPPPGFGPTAPAVVTAGGPPIDWRMPIDKPLAPAPPDGSPRPGNELPRGWIWGAGNGYGQGSTGGPLEKPNPIYNKSAREIVVEKRIQGDVDNVAKIRGNEQAKLTNVSSKIEDVENAAKVKAEELEQLDGGHSIKRHGPDISDADLENRITTGAAPDGKISPTPASTRFNTYKDWVETRQAALDEIVKKEGIDLTQPPKLGEPTQYQIVVEHNRAIDDGFIGDPTSKAKVIDPTTGKKVPIHNNSEKVEGITRTKTSVEWNSTTQRWQVAQHFPWVKDWDNATKTYAKPADATVSK